MNNVYFSNEGLTSTDANYYANIAKEMQNAATERLNNVKFFRTLVAVIGSQDKQPMSVGTEDITFIPKDLELVSSLNAFCAWVREAIKEKDHHMAELNSLTYRDWAELNGFEIPESPSYPRDPTPISEQSIIDSWDINKRNKYLKLEAFAATYGKYIHVDGAYSKARKKAHAALNNPITKEGTGRDMILYQTESTIPIEAVDTMFMALQDTYRSYEKELNRMKAEIKDAVNNLTREAYDQHQIAVDTYKELVRAYNDAQSNLRSKFVTWRTNESERISKLKITIPDSLKGIFKIIKEVGDTSKKS